MLCLKTFVAGAYLTPPYPYTFRPPSLGLKVFFNLSLMSTVNGSLETTQCIAMSRIQFDTGEGTPGDKSSLRTGSRRILDLNWYLEILRMQLKSYKHMPRVQVCRLVLLIQVKSALTGRVLGIWSGFCCQ